MWATFDEWRRNGRVVEQGKKNPLRDPNGNPLFHHSQTVDENPKYEDDFVIEDFHNE
jgi:hypothetical protein